METKWHNYRVNRDILYGCDTTGHEHKYKTDLYIPENQHPDTYECCTETEIGDVQNREINVSREKERVKPPVAIFVHGGGWRRGDKDAWKHFIFEDINLLAAFIFRFYSLYGNVGVAMARRGIPCAVMSYPLTRLKSSWMLLELLTSYMASVLFLGVLFGLIILFGLCMKTLLSFELVLQILNVPHTLPVPLTFGRHTFLLHLLISNICILTILSLQWHRYGLKKYTVFLIWASLILVSVFLKQEKFDITTEYLILYFLSLGISQGVLLLSTLSRKPATPNEQVAALAECIIEVKKYGRESEIFDEHSIFLMGHSAGGHLCTLATLCGKQLIKAGVSANDIKGVIAISAVLDVDNLNKSPISQLYLHPTFGTDKDLWQSLSPIHKIRHTPHHIPQFLVVTAQYDFHLNKDASDFCYELKKRDCKIRSVTIPRTNHTSIILYFDVHVKTLNLADICSEFIYDTQLYQSQK